MTITKSKKFQFRTMTALLVCLISLSGCNSGEQQNVEEVESIRPSVKELPNIEVPVKLKEPAQSIQPNPNVSKKAAKTKDKIRPLICIEAGHQRKANLDQEPSSPGSKQMKNKVNGGTRGAATGRPESELNLEVALKLEAALKEDYQIEMVRTSQEVDISNRERAEHCNEVNADVMIRIHADGNEDKNVRGMTFFYPAPNNEYTKLISGSSFSIAQIIEQHTIHETNALSNGIKSREDLTGFNWIKIPSVLIEMGFMTNPDEDLLMSDPDYQRKIINGIKSGLDSYFLTQ